jgi:aspartyl-tRNA(Asn)/glutamyl-tRNA(Gln) amidotransferase subunit C
MSGSLSMAEVERIAGLAHLELTEHEKTTFASQLADILAYAEHVQLVDTTGVTPTEQVSGATGVEREDEPQPSVATAEFIANAPDGAPEAGLFRVPRVIG